ncbi:MAG: lysylphosphatidylglycerol synthase domain-containing protein [Rhizobacter sp.]
MGTDTQALPRQDKHTPHLSLTQRSWWPAAKRTATAVFFALVLWLIVRHARTVQWSEVWDSITGYPALTLAAAAGFAFASHALYATFDLLSRSHTGHTLPTGRVIATTFISYAFNLNFGSLIGGLAFRLRLYTRQGLETGVIARVFAFSMLTNWIGYLLLVGVLAFVQPIAIPDEWSIGVAAMRAVGALMVAAVLLYVGLCFFSPKRTLGWRQHELSLPSGRMALLQVALSTLNWSLIGAAIYTLLQHHGVSYPAALAVLLAAAVAGVVTHVPAGLGVLEAVFVTMLSPPVAQSPLLAALLVYRALYYLLPLALALVGYVLLEARLKKPA